MWKYTPPYLQIRRINVINVFTLPKAICGFNVIYVEISMAVLLFLGKKNHNGYMDF